MNTESNFISNPWQRFKCPLTTGAVRCLRLLSLMCLAGRLAIPIFAEEYKVLKSFGLVTNVSGYEPTGPLTQGPDGVLYGTTVSGEGSLAGTVFKLNPDGTGFTVLKMFTNSVEGAGPWGGLILAGNTLYGATQNGGYFDQDSSSGYGVVFKVNTDGSGYAVLRAFNGNGGGGPNGDLVLAGSTLYGSTFYGGSSEHGVVFKLNTDGSGYTVLKNFLGDEGWAPSGGLLLAGGALYGTTEMGGTSDPMNNPNGAGVVFKLNTDGSDYAVLKRFTGSDGAGPNGSLALAGSTLYGTTYGGGSNDVGVIFKVDTDGSGYAVLKNFTGSGASPGEDGQWPNDGLALAGDTLYGTTAYGGSGNCGVLFAISTNGTGYSVLKHFTGDDGCTPLAGLLLAGGTLYGTGSSGGDSYHGVVFRLNADGSSYTVLKSFGSSDGINPAASPVLAGSTLYGTTAHGGTSDNGTLFKLNADGSDYAILKSFNGSDGSNPNAGLVLAGNTLYGTTISGGPGEGVVFKMSTDGSGYAVLKSFTGSDGREPNAGLVLAGNTLYGTTEVGGSSDSGVVFRVNTDGSAYAVLKNFTDAEGRIPCAALALSGSTLYGTTVTGGSSDAGVIFKMNTDGSDYVVLKSFTVSDGASPYASLALASNTLYGTTSGGGNPDRGVIFKLNTDGSGYTVLTSFTDGRIAAGDLVLVGSRLYGTTSAGGSSDSGVIFAVNTDGSGYEVIKTFAGGDGVGPNGLILASNTLYGTTFYGGNLNCGVVFSLTMTPPSITTLPLTQTAEIGTTIGLTVHAASDLPLKYQWYFNGTNALSCTTSSLVLSSVLSSESGTYTVTVSDAFGAVTSAPVAVNVIPGVPRRPVPGVMVMGQPGSSWEVVCADSLSSAPNWATLGSVSLSGTPQYYFDLTQPLPPQRFYRAWQTADPVVLPVLDLHMVPAITVTGSIGNSVRVDAINRFGPIDGWVTLATVTLTNTSQLYFDVSAPGQPERLYRLVPSH